MSLDFVLGLMLHQFDVLDNRQVPIDSEEPNRLLRRPTGSLPLVLNVTAMFRSLRPWRATLMSVCGERWTRRISGRRLGAIAAHTRSGLLQASNPACVPQDQRRRSCSRPIWNQNKRLISRNLMDYAEQTIVYITTNLHPNLHLATGFGLLGDHLANDAPATSACWEISFG